MAAGASVSVPIADFACADFSDLREIKKQLLDVAERSRERGLQHSGKWYGAAGGGRLGGRTFVGCCSDVLGGGDKAGGFELASGRW